MDKREIIKSNNAPEAIGAYSQAVSVSGFLFISGQISIDKNVINILFLSSNTVLLQVPYIKQRTGRVKRVRLE